MASFLPRLRPPPTRHFYLQLAEDWLGTFAILCTCLVTCPVSAAGAKFGLNIPRTDKTTINPWRDASAIWRMNHWSLLPPHEWLVSSSPYQNHLMQEAELQQSHSIIHLIRWWTHDFMFENTSLACAGMAIRSAVQCVQSQAWYDDQWPVVTRPALLRSLDINIVHDLYWSVPQSSATRPTLSSTHLIILTVLHSLE